MRRANPKAAIPAFFSRSHPVGPISGLSRRNASAEGMLTTDKRGEVQLVVLGRGSQGMAIRSNSCGSLRYPPARATACGSATQQKVKPLLFDQKATVDAKHLVLS